MKTTISRPLYYFSDPFGFLKVLQQCHITVVLQGPVVMLGFKFMFRYRSIIPTSFRTVSLALGQSYHCNTCKAIMENMGKWGTKINYVWSYNHCKTKHNYLYLIIIQTLVKALSNMMSKHCQICSVVCVTKLKTILLITIYAIHGLYVFSLSIFLLKIFVHYLIITKSEIWIINHCLALGYETKVYIVGLAKFLGTSIWLDFFVGHFMPWCMAAGT